MMDSLDTISEKLAEGIDLYLLASIKAKKEDIKTRDDLKGYAFKCQSCNHLRPADSAVILSYPLQVTQVPSDAGVRVDISKRIALICRNCSELL